MEKNQWIIVVVITILLFLLLGYGVYTKLDIEDEKLKIVIKWVTNISILIIIMLAVIFGYKQYLKLTGKSGVPNIKTAIPDDHFEHVKKRMIFQEGVKGYHDKSGKLHFAPGAVVQSHRRPFVSKGSGEEFIAQELFCRTIDCPNPGSRLIVLPLSRESKYVQGGLYTDHERTTLFQWIKDKSYLKKLALTTPQNESLRLTMMDKEGDIDLEQYHSLSKPEYPTKKQKSSDEDDNETDRIDNYQDSEDDNA